MKTYSLKQGDIRKEWQLLDARGMVLGRLAAHIASILRGKHKPEFSPHLDCGDPVVVINAAEVRLTGNKLDDKRFYWHTGYPGGIKEISPKKQLEGKFPERLLIKAVERMLPKGPLGRQQMSQLKVFAGAEHRHEAQSPKAFDFAAQNSKNTPRPR